MDIEEFNKEDILGDFGYELNKLCRSCIGTATEIKIKQQPLINLFEKIVWFYEKEKEKNKKLSEQNEDMKALFNIQASIAKELDFNTNEKMVKFKDEYYVPDTMTLNANIGEPKTIELRYISATKYLTKFDVEE